MKTPFTLSAVLAVGWMLFTGSAYAEPKPVELFLPQLSLVVSEPVEHGRSGFAGLAVSNSTPSSVWVYRSGSGGGALVVGADRLEGTNRVALIGQGLCLHPNTHSLQELKPGETIPLHFPFQPEGRSEVGTFRFVILAEAYGLSPDSWLLPRRRLFARHTTGISTDTVTLSQRTR
jgi:hypothetical protein